MADTIRGKLTEAGNTVAEAAQKAANKASEKAGEAKDWVAQKIDKVKNRADESATEARHADEEAEADAQARAGN